MKNNLLLLFLSLIVLSSCSTIYKSGQTPDDVYYSPVRTIAETTVRQDRREEEQQDDWENRQIRRGISNPRWRYYDNEFSYNPYSFGYNNNNWNGYNSFSFNSGFGYNPYLMGYNNCCCNSYLPGHGYNNMYTPYVVYQPVYIIPKNNTPRMTNLGAYGNSGYNSNNNSYNTKTNNIPRPTRSYNNTNTGSRLGNTLNKVFNTGNNSSYRNNQSTNSNRTYTPSSSSSSSSGSSRSSSSGTGVSRPSRGKG